MAATDPSEGLTELVLLMKVNGVGVIQEGVELRLQSFEKIFMGVAERNHTMTAVEIENFPAPLIIKVAALGSSHNQIKLCINS